MKLIKKGIAIALLPAVLSTPTIAQNAAELTPVSTQTKAQPVTFTLESKTMLMNKLANIKHFSADFDQQILDENGSELQKGSGTLTVSKPNLVHWETKTPDESLIVSDGTDLWFYDPFVEQVSVYPLKNAIANTPILLITNNDPTLWQAYDVARVNEFTFSIHAKDENARVKTLELSFSKQDNNSSLTGFTILDATGQLSVISLTHLVPDQQPSSALFEFIVPEGVYVDDQR